MIANLRPLNENLLIDVTVHSNMHLAAITNIYSVLEIVARVRPHDSEHTRDVPCPKTIEDQQITRMRQL